MVVVRNFMPGKLVALGLCVVIGWIAFCLHEPRSVPGARPSEFESPAIFLPVSAVASPVLAADTSSVPSVSIAAVSVEAPDFPVPANDPEIDLTAEKIGNAEKEKYQLLHAMRDWAAQDGKAALAAALRLPGDDQRNQVLTEVCFGLAQKDPAEGVRLAKSLHLDDQPGAVMEYLVQQWAAVDRGKSVDWVKAQPPSAARDGLIVRVASVLVQSSPAEAAYFVLDQMSAGERRDDALLMVVHQWGSQDPLEAKAWVKMFPAGILRDQSMEELQLVQIRQQGIANQ